MIERAVYVALKIFRETIESLYGVAESAIVVATITAIIRITSNTGLMLRPVRQAPGSPQRKLKTSVCAGSSFFVSPQ